MIHSPPYVAIINLRFLYSPETSLTFDVGNQIRKIRSKQVLPVPPVLQANLQAHCLVNELRSTQRTGRLATKHLALTANGTMHMVPHELFNVLLSSFSLFLAHLSKITVNGHKYEPLERFSAVNALKPHPIQCNEHREDAESLTALTRASLKNPTLTRNHRARMPILVLENSEYVKASWNIYASS